MIAYCFLEEMRMGLLPCFEGLKRGLMVERFLRVVFAVEPGVAVERGFQVQGALEGMSTEDLRQPSVEALHYAIGARRLRLGQAVLDSQCLAERVKLMGSGSILGFLAEDPIGELLAVIDEDGSDFHGRRLWRARGGSCVRPLGSLHA
ncbi:hypothetical protein MAMT_01288 [Methylacidimicrobium tartarophylax]|uniref:Uncharacterized protein n=1 Tax=Methylacidimicrobium tartarophylax TaxID=1041768 RepID=A0A5E6ME05_9BACT|nr:hypothetical protein MAMT_01288 [Methylacidimicrobium tartarophylax]